MNTRQVAHHYRLTQWAPIIQECKKSGMNVKNWCLENNVNEKQYYYWQRKIREELSGSLIQREESKSPSTFIPISQLKPSVKTPSTFQPDLVLSVGSIKVEISNSISPALLNEMLKIINHV